MRRRLPVVAAVVVAALVGAWIVVATAVSLDGDGDSFGRALVIIDGVPAEGASSASEALAGVARARGADLALLRPGDEGTEQTFELHVVHGEPLAPVTDTVAVVEGGTVPFGEVRGYWVTNEVGDDLDDLAHDLETAGFSAKTEEIAGLSALVSTATTDTSLVLVSAALAALVAGTVAEGQRRRGLRLPQALAGWTLRRMLLREMFAMLLVAGVVCGAAALVALGAWGAATGFRRPDVVVPLSVAAGLAVVVTSVVVATLVAGTASVLQAVGRRAQPSGRARQTQWARTSVAVHVLLVALATIDATLVVSAGTAATTARDDAAAATDLSEYRTLGIGIPGAVDGGFEEVLAQITRSEFRRGAAVLSDAQLVPGLLLTTRPPTGTPEASGRIDVSETGAGGGAGAAAAVLTDRLSFSWGLTGEHPPLEVVARTPRVDAVDVSAARATPFRPAVEAVAVFPRDGSGQSDADLAASAFNGHVLFADHERVRSSFAAAGAGALVQTYDRVADRYEAAVADARARQLAALLAAVVVGTAALVGIVSGTTGHVVRHRRAAAASRAGGRLSARVDARHVLISATASLFGAGLAGALGCAADLATARQVLVAAVAVVLVLEVARLVVLASWRGLAATGSRWRA